MKSFKYFITEAEEAPEPEGEKLKHITHAEDRPLQKGPEGFRHAVEALKQAHNHIKSGGHSSALSMKYDGSPSLVFGHHPESGKFFVASKSAFNKTPKINFTHDDIAKNHGHAPGLMAKLHDSLNHLKKITPKTGVYQGDLMFSGDDKKETKNGVSFTPNTIRYTAKGHEADKVRKAKLGIVVHTQYHGDSAASMKADPHPDLHNFKEHPDVWRVSPNHDTRQVHYSDEAQKEFNNHIKAAEDIHKKHGKQMYSAVQPHSGSGGHMETYINHTVKTDEKPSAEGLAKHIMDKAKKASEKVKTPAAKAKKTAEGQEHVNHIMNNKQHYNNMFNMHDHLQKAKDVLVHTLNQHEGGLEHHVEVGKGEMKRTDPEGFVVHYAGEPTKLVNRKEFSKINLLKVRK
jgi:Family of unknown function (DUF6267)